MTGPFGWLLWGLAHLAFMPAAENRLTLLTKWLCRSATGQRAGLLFTGRQDQHMGVEVGLERAEWVEDSAAPQPQEPAAAA